MEVTTVKSQTNLVKTPILSSHPTQSTVSMGTSSSMSAFSERAPFSIACFSPSLFAVISFGLFLILISASTTGLILGLLSTIFAYFIWEWLDLYGSRLTRREHVYFDEKNILETSQAFDFLLGPVIDDSTPGGTILDSCCGKYPGQNWVNELIVDPKQKELQKFYKQHYGNMYQIALRASQEAKATETLKSKPSSVPSSSASSAVSEPTKMDNNSGKSPTSENNPKN